MLPETYPNRLLLQRDLVMAYKNNGQTKEAIELLEHVVQVEKTILPETRPDRLASQRGLATVYWDNGQIKEAIDLIEHVVKVQSRLPETNSSQIASHYALAVV
ncbi:hypothetical protein GGP41_003958 [Bipolaris sorokiniana]|uniref:MalT-like TPR region domain-containing protein n=2 Tax=Cochliobolus sativus TaxID=45130 RepID=A0A8H6DWK0_COCSA|nr:uncharacterized protein COCSADRAFT_28687 [Bipolaris sorokiniana ND90Pr]EMD61326.1 hypothetical protein COCSADRAFT_28687 [Bipolaris sorokiniana ND90Pr]KAF5851116.1 hypothetical protein GGP41_003958 [Bipolaris sorokiniana]